jgi:hypothetical protein
MLAVPAVEFSDPVVFDVDVVADNFSFHASIMPPTPVLFPKRAITGT